MKEIRESLGSADFPRKVFDKVFKEEIERLRSMEDLWKTRIPPQVLDFDLLAMEANTVNTSIAQFDQVTWTLVQNFAVFQDR